MCPLEGAPFQKDLPGRCIPLCTMPSASSFRVGLGDTGYLEHSGYLSPEVAGLWDYPCKGFLIEPPRDNVYIFVMVGLWTSRVYSEL